METASHVNHAVVRELDEAVYTRDLTRRSLEKMLNAREKEMASGQFDSMQDLINHSEDTVSNLLYLTLDCVGVQTDDVADTAASHVGIAYGITVALRSTASNATRYQELTIPADVARRHSLPSQYLLRPESGPIEGGKEALQGAVYEMASIARFHLNHARKLQHQIKSSQAKLCLLPAVSSIFYLDNLESVGYDVLHPDVNIIPGVTSHIGGKWGAMKLPLLLGRSWLTGVF